jgi:hypothetical protein
VALPLPNSLALRPDPCLGGRGRHPSRAAGLRRGADRGSAAPGRFSRGWCPPAGLRVLLQRGRARENPAAVPRRNAGATPARGPCLPGPPAPSCPAWPDRPGPPRPRRASWTRNCKPASGNSNEPSRAGTPSSRSPAGGVRSTGSSRSSTERETGRDREVLRAGRTPRSGASPLSCPTSLRDSARSAGSSACSPTRLRRRSGSASGSDLRLVPGRR